MECRPFITRVMFFRVLKTLHIFWTTFGGWHLIILSTMDGTSNTASCPLVQIIKKPVMVSQSSTRRRPVHGPTELSFVRGP